MPVLYNGQSVIPAPLCTIRHSPNTTQGGEKLGSVVTITLRSSLVAFKGSPDSDGVFWDQPGYPPDETVDADARLDSLLAKQVALKNLFAEDGKLLEIQPLNGGPTRSFRPRNIVVEFEEGVWFDRTPYVVTMEADADDDADGVQDASEEWTIEPADEKGVTFRITHACSATGKKTYDGSGNATAAWQNARTYVLNQIGLGLVAERMSAPDVLDADDLQAFNYVRQQALNELTGTFSVTESWVGYDPQGGAAAVEEFTVDGRTDSAGMVTVAVSGEIRGLEVRNNTTHALVSTRYDNAASKWSSSSSQLFSRAQTLSGYTLNPQATATQVARNQSSGVISYAWEYSNRAAPTVSGALSEVVTVTNQGQADVHAALPVVGRALGPVLQDIGTKTAKRRVVNVEVVVGGQSYGGSEPAQPDVTTIVNNLAPGGSQVFKDQDEDQWSPRTGRYTRTVAWTWE